MTYKKRHYNIERILLMLKARNKLNSGIWIILAVILICSVLFLMTGVPALAAEGDQTETDTGTENEETGETDTGETENDDPDAGDTGANDDNTENDDTTTEDDNTDSGEADDGHNHGSEEETEEKSAFEKWWDSYNQIIGYCVAFVILIAIIVTIILWIPKDDKKAKAQKK